MSESVKNIKTWIGLECTDGLNGWSEPLKSCVRTSLLLCGGYECQEKEGTFMIAFPEPKAAVEWALTLQLALLR